MADVIRGVDSTGRVHPVLVSSDGKLEIDAAITVDNINLSASANTQYTEGDTDSSITGIALLWEDTADTLSTVKASKPLPIGDAGGSLTVDDGGSSITVDGIVSVSGAVHVDDNSSSLTVDDGGSSLTVDGTIAATQSGTWNVATVSTITNVVHVDDNSGVLSVDDAGGSLTVDGTVAATQSGTWNTRIQDGSGNALTSSLLGSQRALAIQVVDGSGNQVTSFGGAGGTASNFSSVIPSQGTAIGFQDNSGNMAPGLLDVDGNLKVNVVVGGGGGGSGTQYTEGDIDATITGTAMLWEDTSNTLRSVSAAKPLPVSDAGGTLSIDDGAGNISIDDGGNSITVDNGGTFAVQATIAAGATTIGKAEDVASSDSDVGVPAMAVRKATPANTSSTDGDYEMLQMAAGRLWVDASGKTLTVDGSGSTQPVSGTLAVSSVTTSITPGTSAAHLGKAEDAAAGSGDTGVAVLAVRRDSASSGVSTDGDYANLSVDSNGALRVSGASGTTQYVEDTSSAGAESLCLVGAVRRDAAASSAGTDGDYATINTDATGNLRVNISATDLASVASTTDSISAKLATDKIMNDTTALTPKFAKISASSSGANTVVSAVGGKKIRVLAWDLSASASVNAKWQSHVSPTDLTGLYYMTTNTCVPRGFNPVGYFETVSGEALDLNLSSAVPVGGVITYVEV